MKKEADFQPKGEGFYILGLGSVKYAIVNAYSLVSLLTGGSYNVVQSVIKIGAGI